MAEMEKGVKEFTEGFTKKIEKGVLPPDPARVIRAGLRGPVAFEHVLPLPPLVERVHDDFTEKAVEELPRAPLTSDFPEEEWLKWKKE